MAKRYYPRPLKVEFFEQPLYMKARVDITHSPEQYRVTFVAPSWADLFDYVRRLTNPASRT